MNLEAVRYVTETRSWLFFANHLYTLHQTGKYLHVLCMTACITENVCVAKFPPKNRTGLESPAPPPPLPPCSATALSLCLTRGAAMQFRLACKPADCRADPWKPELLLHWLCQLIRHADRRLPGAYWSHRISQATYLHMPSVAWVRQKTDYSNATCWFISTVTFYGKFRRTHHKPLFVVSALFCLAPTNIADIQPLCT